MADWTLILNHIKNWEGGLSADPRDTCADYPSDVKDSRGRPYHTNKGVCYKTWVGLSKNLGFDPSGKAFVGMTTEQWRKIVKVSFWDAMRLDELPSQNIAELLLEVRWGSGVGAQGRAFMKELQRLIGLPPSEQDGYFGNKTFDALKKYISVKGNESDLYNKLWKFRYEQLNKLGKSSTYAWAREGWLNRMNSLLKRSKGFVMDNPKTFGILGLLVLVGFSYAAFKHLGTRTIL